MQESHLSNHLNDIPETASQEKPFIIELERLDRKPGGYFRPHASLMLTSTLRTSGLLTALPPDELKSLLFMLSFLHPNGHCTPSVMELSQAMRISDAKVRSRMQRLVKYEWEGKPTAVEIQRESGLDAFSPSAHLIEVREQQRQCPHCGSDILDPPQDTNKLEAARQRRREQIVAHSRERYARPRAEVEAAIARQMGWEAPDAEDNSEAAQTWRQLIAIGVTREQSHILLTSFDLEAIRQQLMWLPYRKAKNPAAFLVAAVEGRYDPPLALRSRTASEPDTPSLEAPGILDDDTSVE